MYIFTDVWSLVYFDFLENKKIDNLKRELDGAIGELYDYENKLNINSEEKWNNNSLKITLLVRELIKEIEKLKKV